MSEDRARDVEVETRAATAGAGGPGRGLCLIFPYFFPVLLFSADVTSSSIGFSLFSLSLSRGFLLF